MMQALLDWIEPRKLALTVLGYAVALSTVWLALYLTVTEMEW